MRAAAEAAEVDGGGQGLLVEALMTEEKQVGYCTIITGCDVVVIVVHADIIDDDDDVSDADATDLTVG